MTPRLSFWAFTATLAGILFGFDTGVISEAEQAIQDLWGLSPAPHGLAMSAALWSTVVGSLLRSFTADRFGRRATLLWIGVLNLVSAVWSALATEPLSFMLARFIGGFGVGVSTVAASIFISEIAPAASREVPGPGYFKSFSSLAPSRQIAPRNGVGALNWYAIETRGQPKAASSPADGDTERSAATPAVGHRLEQALGPRSRKPVPENSKIAQKYESLSPKSYESLSPKS